MMILYDDMIDTKIYDRDHQVQRILHEYYGKKMYFPGIFFHTSTRFQTQMSALNRNLQVGIRQGKSQSLNFIIHLF